MRVATKSVSRDGDIKGKYLFARPGGAAYMKGPPPDTKPRKRQYLDPKMMRMAPYPGMARYNAYANNVQIPPRPFEPPTVEVPEDVKDEPVIDVDQGIPPPSPSDQQVVKYEPTESDVRQMYPDVPSVPNDVMEMNQLTPRPDVLVTPETPYSQVRDALERGANMLIRFQPGSLENRFNQYATAVLPEVSRLVYNNEITTEMGLYLLLGNFADYLIPVVRTHNDVLRWLGRRFRDIAVRPVVLHGRRRGIEFISQQVSNYFSPRVPGADLDLLTLPEPIVLPGVEGMQIGPLQGTPTLDVPTSTLDFGEGYSGGGVAGGLNAASFLINYLVATAPEAEAPPPEILRLAGAVSGRAYFAGGRTLRMTPERASRASQIVNSAIRDNGPYNRRVYENVRDYFRRRAGRPG
jgi:hypothetical protein